MTNPKPVQIKPPCDHFFPISKVTNRCRFYSSMEKDCSMKDVSGKNCPLKQGRWGKPKAKFKKKSPKGTPFERETLKTLSLWWSEGAEDDIFWRTPGSGARATQRAKRSKTSQNAYGDLAATDSRGEPFTKCCVVEMKRGYSSWSIMDVLDKAPKMKPQVLEQFWAQVGKDAEKAGGLEPILIFRRDQRVSGIMIRKDLVDIIKKYYGNDPERRMTIRYEEELFCYRLEDFLNWCNPNIFKIWKQNV